jgi:hypothetical protein
MLEEAYGQEAMKKTQVYEWYKHFCDGHVNVNGDPPCRRPSTSTNDKNIKHVCNVV